MDSSFSTDYFQNIVVYISLNFQDVSAIIRKFAQILSKFLQVSRVTYPQFRVLQMLLQFFDQFIQHFYEINFFFLKFPKIFLEFL